MKVYIVQQTWNNSCDGQDNTIIGVYSTLEKAREFLNKTYKDDLEWLEEYCSDKEDWECNDLTENTSYVCWNEYWSFNEILEFELDE